MRLRAVDWFSPRSRRSALYRPFLPFLFGWQRIKTLRSVSNMPLSLFPPGRPEFDTGVQRFSFFRCQNGGRRSCRFPDLLPSPYTRSRPGVFQKRPLSFFFVRSRLPTLQFADRDSLDKISFCAGGFFFLGTAPYRRQTRLFSPLSPLPFRMRDVGKADLPFPSPPRYRPCFFEKPPAFFFHFSSPLEPSLSDSTRFFSFPPFPARKSGPPFEQKQYVTIPGPAPLPHFTDFLRTKKTVIGRFLFPPSSLSAPLRSEEEMCSLSPPPSFSESLGLN